MRKIGRVTWIGHDNAVALREARAAFKLSPGDVVRFCVSGDESCNTVREGEHLVDRVEYDAGVVHMRRPARSTTPTATEHDWLFAYERDAKLDDRGIGKATVEDHAALVAYLLSAVRGSDWHAVSDAANDLRVLEARSK